MKKLAFLLSITLLLAAQYVLTTQYVGAEPRFDDIPPSPTLIPLRQTLGLRVGFISSGLFSSKQGRPFFYFDTGLRYKTESTYFDLRLPALMAGFDGLGYLFQSEVLNRGRTSFNFFETLNSTLQYGAYIEPGILKIGQTWRLSGDNPLKITLGGFAISEFVFFDLALFEDRDLENFEPRNDPNAADPFIIALGGFAGFSGGFSEGEYDLVFGVGPDLFQDPDYSANTGWIIFADLDVQYDIAEDVAISLRTKLSTYTHTKDLVYTLVVNGGVVVRLY